MGELSTCVYKAEHNLVLSIALKMGVILWVSFQRASIRLNIIWYFQLP